MTWSATCAVTWESSLKKRICSDTSSPAEVQQQCTSNQACTKANTAAQQTQVTFICTASKKLSKSKLLSPLLSRCFGEAFSSLAFLGLALSLGLFGLFGLLGLFGDFDVFSGVRERLLVRVLLLPSVSDLSFAESSGLVSRPCLATFSFSAGLDSSIFFGFFSSFSTTNSGVLGRVFGDVLRCCGCFCCCCPFWPLELEPSCLSCLRGVVDFFAESEGAFPGPGDAPCVECSD